MIGKWVRSAARVVALGASLIGLYIVLEAIVPHDVKWERKLFGDLSVNVRTGFEWNFFQDYIALPTVFLLLAAAIFIEFYRNKSN